MSYAADAERSPVEQFELFAPAMFKRYTRLLEALLRWDEDLDINPQLSAFAASTFNAGEAVATVPHLDCINFGAGWCCVTALGDFNPKVEGHLVLWDWGIVVEFPPASSAFLPSAFVTHSNTAIVSGKTRMSFTQYTGAVCFRFVDCGNMTLSDYKAANPHVTPDVAKRVRDGLRMYQKFSDLNGS